MIRAFAVILLSLMCILSACKDGTQRPYPEDIVVDDTRFTKVHLAGNLDEPMEIAIRKDGSVIIVERKGAVKCYDPHTGKVSLAHTFRVFSGLEDGLLGVALDPGHDRNHFIYFFYSPAGPEEIQRVSRFTMKGAELDTLSEKVIIEIPTQRKECCHSAGSLAFGPDGNLFIAVGDNTNPHNPGYYNSIDERPGRAFWDAQRTAGNTNDLRGKILRIHIEPDGSYTIPEGNLFSQGDSLARPEIYVMGCRNPYRISVDQKRKWLYWGDVGQNTVDNPARGPISYDEWNVAKEAGFFGWPYFAGPNAPYADFDFATEEVGSFFDPAKPVNHSVNNTGRKVLPHAQGALIWYSYDESRDFAHLGTGGKSPIGGPVYHAGLYNHSATDSSIALPSYYSGKLFIAEWLRDWINVVTLSAEGKVQSIEPFMKNTKFSHPIELEIGPEGALYILEYGVNWFSKNDDAALYRIEYTRGNRPPVVTLQGQPLIGSAPLTVSFSSEGTFDPDSGSRLKYAWYFDSNEIESRDANPTYTFRDNGIYKVKLVVEDEKGRKTTATTEVKAGNDMPVVSLRTEGNSSFYWPEKAIRYAVDVEDREDGKLRDGTIDASRVKVNLTYSTMGTDMTLVEQSEEFFNSSSTGWTLMKESDCRACHAISEKSVGPAFLEIARKYPAEKKNIEALAEKVIAGGSGVWGESVMSAHPQLSRQQAEEMVSFILSLGDNAKATRPLATSGSFIPDDHLKDGSAGDYILTATYQDKEVKGVGSNTVRKRLIFRNPVLNAVAADSISDAEKQTREVSIGNEGWILFQDIDLTDIHSVVFNVSSHLSGGEMIMRVDNPDGEEVSRVRVPRDTRKPRQKEDGEMEYHWRQYRAPVAGSTGRHNLFIVFHPEASGQRKDNEGIYIKQVRFNP